MVTLDYILIAIVLLFGALGWKKGFLRSVGSIVGLVLAAVLASRYYVDVGSWFGGTNFSNVIAFLLIFSITSKLVSLLFWILGKIFKLISIIPFLQSFDRLLGAIFGLVEGVFVLSIFVYFMSKYPINDWLTSSLEVSVVAGVLLKIGIIFVPLFPETLKKLKSII